MSTELRPAGIACNLACRYCYQHPMRDAGNILDDRNVSAMLAAAEARGSKFTLFGGEALLAPLAVLERLWAFGLERFKENGIQTNGSLATDAHFALFKRYAVHVGVSLDGPEELNDVRWAGSLEKTRALTARSQATLDRLLAERIPCSLIVTLSRGNATPERLPRLKAWLTELDAKGLGSARVHLLEVDSAEVRANYTLTAAEQIGVLRELARFERELRTLRFDLFKDIRALLTGKDSKVTCHWNACDPLATSAVYDIDETGAVSNCGRVNKDGVVWLKAERPGFERSLALAETPIEDGGCRGCRYFIVCKGHCPGTAIGGDWRNRSEHCEVWKALIEEIEGHLLAAGQRTVTLHPERGAIEKRLLDGWRRGENLGISGAIARITNPNAPASCSGHGDAPHADRPHGDSHGDHTDAGARP